MLVSWVPASSFVQTPLCSVPTIISYLGDGQSVLGDLLFTLLSILNTMARVMLSHLKLTMQLLSPEACRVPHFFPREAPSMNRPPVASNLSLLRSPHFRHSNHTTLCAAPQSPWIPPQGSCTHRSPCPDTSRNHRSSLLQAYAFLWGPYWPSYLKGHRESPFHQNSLPPSAIPSSKVLITIYTHNLSYSFISPLSPPPQARMSALWSEDFYLFPSPLCPHIWHSAWHRAGPQIWVKGTNTGLSRCVPHEWPCLLAQKKAKPSRNPCTIRHTRYSSPCPALSDRRRHLGYILNEKGQCLTQRERSRVCVACHSEGSF